MGDKLLGTPTKQSMILDNGGVITLPPYPKIGNLSAPDLSIYGTTQLYDLCTRYRFNEKSFIYCKANSGGKLRADSGAHNLNAMKLAYSALAAAVVAGQTYIDVTAAAITEDAWKGGLVWMGHETADGALTQNRGIVGNSPTGQFASGKVRIYLDFPIQLALTPAASRYVEVSGNPYDNLAYGTGSGTGSDQYGSVMCIPCVYIATTAYDYFWGQTWGPCWVCPGAAGFGAALEERQMCFDGYGHLIDLYMKLHTTGHAGQLAGFLLDNTSAPEDIEQIMLQISP